jgi:hydrogenase maturation protease
MTKRVLVAGVGNVFCGDDAFGVVVVDRLRRRSLPAGVHLMDVGIRGIDLGYALHDGWDATILVDAMSRGNAPGTLYVVEPNLDDPSPPPGPALALASAHDLHPESVLRTAVAAGARVGLTRIVGCEPKTLSSDGQPAPEDAEEDAPWLGALSPCVRRAVVDATDMVESILRTVTQEEQPHA